MNPFEQAPQVNVLKSERLEREAKPIIAAILTGKDENMIERCKSIGVTFFSGESLTKKAEHENWKEISKIKKEGEFVQYYGNERNLRNQDMKVSSGGACVISGCNSRDKWSKAYQNCTGVAAIGTDKDTGAQISVFSHQDPWRFLKQDINGAYVLAETFSENLTSGLEELKSKSVPGTIDVVIFGGLHSKLSLSLRSNQEYEDSIGAISAACRKIFEFDPVVITGPSVNHENDTSAYLDTQNRRLYVVRPEQSEHSTNDAYLPSDIDVKKEKWTIPK